VNPRTHPSFLRPKFLKSSSSIVPVTPLLPPNSPMVAAFPRLPSIGFVISYERLLLRVPLKLAPQPHRDRPRWHIVADRCPISRRRSAPSAISRIPESSPCGRC
jgi:hypothetical protein